MVYLLFCSYWAIFLLALEAPASQIVWDGATAGRVAQLCVVSAIRVRAVLHGHLVSCVLLRLVDRIDTLVIFQKFDLVQFWHPIAEEVATRFGALFNMNFFILGLDERLDQLVSYGLLPYPVCLVVHTVILVYPTSDAAGIVSPSVLNSHQHLCALFFRRNLRRRLQTSINFLLKMHLLGLRLAFGSMLLAAAIV